MKVYIPVGDNPSTGKGFFCQRLEQQMREAGVEMSGPNKSDVSLHLIRLQDAGGKRVVRLDGVYHNKKQNWKQRNRPLKKNLHRADAAIYQSEFSRGMCDEYLGKFDGPTKVIPNGADPRYYETVKLFEKKHEHVFFTSSRWRPHKRLRDIIECFRLADIPDSILYVAGGLQKSGLSKSEKRTIFSDGRVQHLGKLSQEQLGGVLRAADAFIHLCWFDSCPNGVVEAIAAKTPVITNNVGGTCELVRPTGGIVCDIDEPYNRKPVKLYEPPAFDRTLIAEAMTRCAAERPVVDPAHIDIRRIANEYLEFFKVIHEHSADR